MMPRFTFECATPDDSPELLAIIEESGAAGNIALLYTRRPDAYASLKHEGENVDIIVCRDHERGAIVGFGSCAVRTVLINGHPTKIGYLFGLRVRQAYRKQYPLLHCGYEFLRESQRDRRLAFYINTILTENQSAQRLLGKPRRCMPTYMPCGGYEIYTFTTRKSRRSLPSAFYFRQATTADLPVLIQFLTEEGRRYQFFPVLTAQDLTEGRFPGLDIHQFYLLFDAQDQIVAAGVLWDQTGYKQYVAQGYHGLLKWLYPVSRWFPLFGFPALPVPGTILRFQTLSFWVVKDNHPDYFRAFLDQILVASNFPLLLVGVHERHPLRSLLRKRPHISYTSRLYLVHWKEQQEAVDALDRTMIPYLECGML
jgi:hypothetical protein